MEKEIEKRAEKLLKDKAVWEALQKAGITLNHRQLAALSLAFDVIYDQK